jgi:hypothetical protein
MRGMVGLPVRRGAWRSFDKHARSGVCGIELGGGARLAVPWCSLFVRYDVLERPVAHGVEYLV